MDPNDTLFKAIREIDSTLNHTTYRVCLHDPPHVVSDGIWGSHVNAGVPMRSSYPVFELQVLVIFAVTQICHFLLKRLGFPLFFSQMMAGLILGPSLEFEILDKFKQNLFPYGSQDTLATISSLGYAVFIFLYGVQMDFSMILRTGIKSWVIAFVGLITPILFGFLFMSLLQEQLANSLGFAYKSLPVVFISHSVTSFAVIAAFLNDLKILNSELGRLALSSALVSDVLSSTLTSTATAVISSQQDHKRIFINLVSLFSFAIFIPLICRPAMLWVIKRTPEGRPVKQVYIYNIIALLFALSCLSTKSNQAFTLGAFILGLAVPEGPPLGSALVTQLELFGKSFLLPIFVTTCMMKADLSLEGTSESMMSIGLCVLVVHLVKIASCLAPALYCKMPISDALSLALIMNCKGVVDVGMYNAVFDRKQIQGPTYGVMMISVMILATIAQISVKYLYDPARKYAGYQKRNIMNLKPNSELRIVACIHKQHHISAITNFLDLCYPTADNPIIVDALHLIELAGRSSPIFISHRLQRNANLGLQDSFSENVFISFENYEHGKNPGAASTSTYTAISPLSLMHEDVCYLALDKLASIIVLPFHRRWSIDGLIESEDKNIRSLNCRVLERAPCSVGILVKHGSLQSESNSLLRLAVVFLGGKDDREALCLAKRASRDPETRLVVYHLVDKDNTTTPRLEKMLNNAVLKDVVEAHSDSRVSYREILVEDGSDIASILRSMVDGHDIFIVGRRHEIETPLTSGLQDWCEFPELGVIGDLLASPDLESRASVLVVQQQQVFK